MITRLLALFVVGSVAPPISLDDQDGVPHALCEAGQATLIVYEDQDGQKQNAAGKALVSAYNTPVENRSKLRVWPVADLSKWNWWPAKGHALTDVKKSAAKSNTKILLDWTGALQKRWGLRKQENSIVLIGADGKVLYVSHGETTPAQVSALERELRALGLHPLN